MMRIKEINEILGTDFKKWNQVRDRLTYLNNSMKMREDLSIVGLFAAITKEFHRRDLRCPVAIILDKGTIERMEAIWERTFDEKMPKNPRILGMDIERCKE